MASIRASVDTMLSSSDYKLLQKEGTKVEGIKGSKPFYEQNLNTTLFP